MAKQQTVAPKERVNITYKASTGEGQEEKELPLKMLALGDYTGRVDDTPLEDRKAINVNKDNFGQVLKEHKLELELQVADKLKDAGGEMSVSLKLQSLRDFEPEGIVDQVPELKKLLELREALTALKGPLSSRRNFRKRLEDLLGDEDARAKLLAQVGGVGGAGEEG